MMAAMVCAPLQAAGEAGPDWAAARWGMDADALAAALPGAVETRLEYGGGLRGTLALPQAQLAGMRFRAIFQLDDDGLRQVLFEKRRREIAPSDAQALLAALREALGPETRACRAAGAETSAEVVWVGADAVWRLVSSDFANPGVFASNGADPRYPLPTARREALRELEILAPGYRAGGPKAQALPRRLLVRWSDPEASALDSRTCPPE
ncbi:hypothetical protein [uncultured Albimonas sp.]|uniref:hypothetical protein n=1 Tax=uncultured Albimonas sp. TaxID=1331701 RepID=UPI0030EE6C25